MNGTTVLVVDDAASVRATVSIALKGGGYEVIEASDGNDALRKPQIKRVHLIISDVNMPGMDGITLPKRLREQAATKQGLVSEMAIPTGMLSSLNAMEF
ncbi:MAG TPA: response regulator [Rhodoferax sp.]|nr:response regulator [Rhodoferax sp.]